VGEFELIDWLRGRVTGSDPTVVLGIGDDAAVLEIPDGQQLVVSTDTLNQDVHFAAGDDPRAIGHKSLAVNLSDLAAMAATPRWLLLNLSLPEVDTQWLEGFITGFAALAARSGTVLVGGDTCRGPCSVTVTAMGLVRPGLALPRSGARPGDRIVVSGVPGLARLALQQRQAAQTTAEACARALDFPEPRLALGAALSGQATACLDLSDGLLADLGHLLSASGCGAELDLARLPDNPAFAGLPDRERWQLQLAGGDDYELCFSISAPALQALRASSVLAGLPLSDIGEVRAAAGIDCRLPDGELLLPRAGGYDHFRAQE
jgi:thiamine-monophosphate kinase